MRILPADWNPQTERLITLALSGNSTLSDIKAQVTGGAKLFKVWNVYMETVAAFVLRVDRVGNGYQGVIVAAGGRAGCDLTATLLPAIEKMFIGCQSVRIHTERVGLVKKLARQGYSGAEIVLFKEL